MKYSNFKLISNTQGTDKQDRVTASIDITYRYGFLWLLEKTETRTIHVLKSKYKIDNSEFNSVRGIYDDTGYPVIGKDVLCLAYAWEARNDVSIFDAVL